MEDMVPLGFLLNPKPLSFPFNRTNLWLTIRTGELGREVGALLLSSQVVGLRRVVGSRWVRFVDEAKSKLFPGWWATQMFFWNFHPEELFFWLIFFKLGWWKNHQPELVSLGWGYGFTLRTFITMAFRWFSVSWPSGCHHLKKKQQLEKRD